jgi:hypothetical protein
VLCGAGPVIIGDASVAAGYVNSLASHYQPQVARPWHEVAEDVREQVQAIIDAEGSSAPPATWPPLSAGNAGGSPRAWPGRQRSRGTCGRVTGTTARTPASPAKSPGLVVNSGRPAAIAVAAIIKSAVLRLGLRPAAITAAVTRP